MNTRPPATTRWLTSTLLALTALATAPAAQATDVGVAISFSQPGVYGRIDIGRYPTPVLVTPRPVVIGRPVYDEPVYLWVPPGHRRDWRHHCRRYGACGAPVYFVQDTWYRQNVVERRQEDRGHDHRHGPGRGRGHGHGHD